MFGYDLEYDFVGSLEGESWLHILLSVSQCWLTFEAHQYYTVIFYFLFFLISRSKIIFAHFLNHQHILLNVLLGSSFVT